VADRVVIADGILTATNEEQDMATDFCEESVALDDQIQAIARSEGLTYAEAVDVWISRYQKPQKTNDPSFDQTSTRLAEKIQKFASKHNLSFSEACDRISQDGFDADAAFERQLSFI